MTLLPERGPCLRTWGTCAKRDGAPHACSFSLNHECYHVDRCMCACGKFRPLSHEELYARACRSVEHHFKLTDDPWNDTSDSEESILEAIRDLYLHPNGEPT